MKKLTVDPVVSINGICEIPGDKSISHRSVILGSLAYGTTKIEHFLASADCLATINIFKKMGVRIKRNRDQVIIFGKGLNSLKPPTDILDAGNSGTSARILLGLLSCQPFTSRLTGDKYLRLRPMKRVVLPLSLMGAKITGHQEGNFLPLKVEPRKLKGIQYRLPVASAQVKSAILMAGLFAEGKTTVLEPSSTRDHTERMFKTFSIPFSKKGKTVSLKGPVAPFKARVIKIPGDISSAAFFIVAGLITPNSKIILKNVGINPTRMGLLDVLRKMKARISVTPLKTGKGEEPIGDLTVHSTQLKSVEVGGDIIPRMIDELPIFAVAATQAQGTTIVRNAEEMKVKESDRIFMMAVNLKKMGANIEATRDGWIIKGPTRLKGCRLFSGGDHRIAMALAIAAVIAKGPTTVMDTENIETSFPGFEKMLKKVSRWRAE